MMFIRIKKDTNKCEFCKLSLLKGDMAVKESYQDGNRKWYYLFYHEDCYTQKVNKKLKELKSKFVQKEADAKLKRKQLNGKVGRPAKYSDRLRALNLINRRRYHEKLQHKDIVESLIWELHKLEISNTQRQPELIIVESTPVVVDTPVPIKQEVTATLVKSGLVSKQEDDPNFSGYAKKEV